jgi:hypothetical protein
MTGCRREDLVAEATDVLGMRRVALLAAAGSKVAGSPRP